MTAPTIPGFVDPNAPGALTPSIRELAGRVVFIQPTRIDYNVPGVGQAAKPQDRITCDITVVDGGPLHFGSKVNPAPTPATHVVETPCTFVGVYVSNVNVVNALKGSLPGPGQPQPGVVLGEIKQGVTSTVGNNAPWNLVALDPHDPRRGPAQQVLTAIIMRQFTNPTPRPIQAAPAPAPAPQYAMPSYGQATAPQYAPPAPAAPAPNSYEAWLASQQPPAAPPAPSIPPPPMGWPVEAWNNLTAEQRAGVMASANGAPPV